VIVCTINYTKKTKKDEATVQDKKYLYFSKDSSLLDSHVGAGLFASWARQVVHQLVNYMAQRIDIFNAKYYGIVKAPQVATMMAKEEETNNG
jgi:hypothetical protein